MTDPGIRAIGPIGTCDWGGCDEVAEGLRWSFRLARWLPVCRQHWHKARTVAPRPAWATDEALCECGAGPRTHYGLSHRYGPPVPLRMGCETCMGKWADG